MPEMVRLEDLHPFRTAFHKAKVTADLVKSALFGDDMSPLALAGLGSRNRVDVTQNPSATTPDPQIMQSLMQYLEATGDERGFEEALAGVVNLKPSLVGSLVRRR